MLKNWQFWFSTIGALITGVFMFSDLKTGFAIQQNEIHHIKKGMTEIKSDVADIKLMLVPPRIVEAPEKKAIKL